MNPKISVVIAYHDERRSPQNIRTWTHTQTFAPEMFEIIVIAHPATPVEPEFKEILRPQDRLIVADVPSGPYPLYCVGAAAARGDILFFSEDHCLAEPGCLESVERFFQSSNEPAATVLWRCINRSNMAKAEAQLNQIDRKIIESNIGWNRVRIRSFAIKRSIYENVGGFDNRYGNFAETLLSASLHQAGHTIGTITQVGVSHINSYKISHLYKDVFSYGWHEAKFCADNGSTLSRQYFDADTILMKDRMIPSIVARSLAIGLAKSLIEEFKSGSPLALIGKPQVRAWLNELWGLLGSISSLRVERLAAWLNVQASQLRFSLWQFDIERRVPAFSDIWQAVMRKGRVDYMVYAGVAPSVKAASKFEAGGDEASNAVGFNSLETIDGHPFRWTKLATFILLDAPRVDQLVIIDTGNIVAEQHCDRSSKFFWNDHLIRDDQVKYADGKLQFSVKASICNRSSEQRLTIISKPHRGSAAETRKLGLPICSITTVPTNRVQEPELAIVGKA